LVSRDDGFLKRRESKSSRKCRKEINRNQTVDEEEGNWRNILVSNAIAVLLLCIETRPTKYRMGPGCIGHQGWMNVCVLKGTPRMLGRRRRKERQSLTSLGEEKPFVMIG
jgi:ribosomal protein L34